jgi:hypothetical protein
MLTPPANLMIYVATQPVDFRKGADGLALLAKETLGHDPMKGVVVVFLTPECLSFPSVSRCGFSVTTKAIAGRNPRGNRMAGISTAHAPTARACCTQRSPAAKGPSAFW